MSKYLTRRIVLRASAAGLAAGAIRHVLPLWAETPPAASRPNVIFIFIDDMGFADPSCFGNPKLKTPNIDRLAAGGMRFTQFYVNSPICSPSRVALTTGQYPARHLIHSYLAARSANRRRGMADFLSPHVFTIGSAFKKAGYATAHFGKWHMGGGRDVQDAPLPSAYGFDEHLVNFEGMGPRVEGPKHTWTQTYVDRSIDFIRRHKDRPFFLRLFPNDVHDAHQPAPGAEAKWKDVTKNPFEAKFFAVLEEMDRQIGRLVDEVDKLHLAERTLIVFTSDNGPTDWASYYAKGFTPPGFTGPYFGRKWSLYEGGIHMPFIVRWPGRVPAGRTDERTVGAAMDMTPTLCKLVGIDVPDNLDGEDLSEAFLGKPVRRKKPIFWEYGRREGYLRPGNKDFISPPLAMREGDYKLLMNQDAGGAQLFNLADDPSERKDLASSKPEVAAAMRQRLLAWRQTLPDLPGEWEGIDFASIGYDPVKGIISPDGQPATPPKRKTTILDLPALARLAGRKGAKPVRREIDETWVFDGRTDGLCVPRDKAPAVAGRGITVWAEIASETPSGVVLAHGGNRHGYSLFLREGKATFSVCVDWKRTTIQAPAPLEGGKGVIEASLARDGKLTLRIDRKEVAADKAAGPLAANPGDSLQIGSDLVQPVGEYEVPNRFRGTIGKLELRID
ncbi:MAG: Arylsulfatase precursor [Planctomycetes bacterium ADurb.Bin126]|nr:MAG: Arylsulfatase precursor [Planctomycetes bacterium ADurb.Bin126]HOD82511.1 sulfatase-like hydrolase/transferase [Phycisphaerae bacterium]HQL74455.1 sulfatase-like hydrolase/transferase [Phycisphaerae bacterium]